MNRHHRQGMRPRAIFAADIRHLGGVVTVHHSTDRVDGTPRYVVGHVSKGADYAWRSPPMADESQADAAARTLAAYVGAVVK
jgi:hypothetical protein